MKPFLKMSSNNTALLIIDVINGCAHEKCEKPELNVHFSKIRLMVPKLVEFIEEYCKTIGGLVIFGKTLPWKKEFLAENINNLYENPDFAYYSQDTTGFSQEFYLVHPAQNDLISDKNTNDAFANPHLIEELEKRGIQYLVTTGVFTDGYVLSTVVGGFSKDYNFIVLRDLVETTDSKIRQDIQQKLLNYTFPYLFARVITSEELLRNWSK